MDYSEGEIFDVLDAQMEKSREVTRGAILRCGSCCQSLWAVLFPVESHFVND
jgi:hypothetical protein